MSGVCYFIWRDDGEERYACVPRDEIRFVAVRRNNIVITLSTTGGHDMTIPFDGGVDNDEDGLEDVGPWTDDSRNLGVTYGEMGQGTHSYSHTECKDKMIEALTQSVDVDCTFRWNGTTWMYTEARPT